MLKNCLLAKSIGAGGAEESGGKSHEDGRFSHAGQSVTQITKRPGLEIGPGRLRF